MMAPTQFIDQILSLPMVGVALLSPDRHWVAFEWDKRHTNKDVFLVPTTEAMPPLALTHTLEATSLIRWAPDSQSLIVAEDQGGDERLTLYRVDLNQPGSMHPLTEFHPPYFVRGGSFSPDNQYLYYGANYDFRLRKLIGPTAIYRQNLSTGECFPLVIPDKPAYTTPELNSAGTHLLYARKDRHPAGRQFHLLDVTSGDDREILNFGDAVKVFARWFPDNENILVISEGIGKGPQHHTSLGVYHWPGARLRWLIDDPKRNIESAWVTPDGMIVVDEIRQAGHFPTCLDVNTGIETPFPDLKGNLLPIGRALDGSWIARYYAATSPVDLVRLGWTATADNEPSEPKVKSLTGVWKLTDLRQAQLAPAELFSWQSTDGLEITGWLYRARPNQKQAILFIHGGPSSHAEDKLHPQIQYFVARGFNVLAVNYRGSTGFGLAFRELIKEDGWGGREQADIVSGAAALIATGLAAAGRVGVTGTSYGGYSAWYLITHTSPELIAAAAPICGMTDLVVDYETTRPDLRPYSEEMLGGSPDQAPERYRERSPIHFLDRIKGKLLIVQGGRDPNVTPENVRQARQRLDELGIPYEILVFEDEGHGIYKSANQAVLFTALADFFGESLKAKAA